MAFLHTGPLLAAAPCLASPDRRLLRFPTMACPPRQSAFFLAEPFGLCQREGGNVMMLNLQVVIVWQKVLFGGGGGSYSTAADVGM